MVLIARVLAQQPRIILLDEPTSHLDLHNQALMLRLLRNLLADGITVACVLHDPNLAFAYADDFVFLHQGCRLLPPAGSDPWSADFLRSVYDTDIHTVPFGERAVVMPTLPGDSLPRTVHPMALGDDDGQVP